MFNLLPLIALAAVASAATLARDGPRDFRLPLSGRIVGGENTTIEEVPYQVSVRFRGRHACGGSIISQYWIVTAAHCTEDSDFLYTVRAGSTVTTSGGSIHRMTAVVPHDYFHYDFRGRPINDIALIRVEQPFDFDETRQPIALFDEYEESPVGAMGTVTGWGTLKQGGREPIALQTVSIPIVSKADCSGAYLGGIPKNQICAAYPEGGKDSCQGDSGGPLAIGGRLSGIVSWGAGCGVPGKPGVYTEVAAYRAWIKHNSGV